MFATLLALSGSCLGAATDPCLRYQCGTYEKCIAVLNEPQCVDSCHGVQCDQGRECVVYGLQHECEQVTTDPCRGFQCGTYEKCITSNNGTAECVDSCHGVQCDQGRKCVVYGLQHECEQVTTDPCRGFQCGTYEKCITSNNGTAECVDSCHGVQCDQGRKCVVYGVEHECEQVTTDPCRGFQCGTYEKCITSNNGTAECVDSCHGVQCDQGRKCVVYGLQHECEQVTTDPCRGFQCGTYEKCITSNNGTAQCVDSCHGVQCDQGRKCVVYGLQHECEQVTTDPCRGFQCGTYEKCITSNNGTAECVDSCHGVQCDQGRKCVVYGLQHECEQVTTDSCRGFQCGTYEKCITSNNGTAQCVDSCHGVQCDQGRKCVVYGLQHECEQVTTDPCRGFQCGTYEKCITSNNGTAQCVDSCHGVQCDQGRKCVVYGLQHECEQVTTDPCRGFQCGTYEKCITSNNGTAECVDSCHGVQCDQGRKCVVYGLQHECEQVTTDPCRGFQCGTYEKCITSNNGTAQCVDSCHGVQCDQGRKCVVYGLQHECERVTTDPCRGFQCGTYEKCITSNNGTAQCVDSCHGVQCDQGRKCVVYGLQHECEQVTTDPCRGFQCGTYEKCITSNNGTAQCVDSCHGVQCDQGRKCVVYGVEHECEQVTTDPCRGFQCGTYETCIAVLNEPQCVDSCHGVQCDQGRECVVYGLQHECEQVTTDPCRGFQCGTYEKCITSNNGTAECVDSCHGVQCDQGRKCVVYGLQHECEVVSVPVEKQNCSAVTCSSGQFCVVVDDVPTCKDEDAELAKECVWSDNLVQPWSEEMRAMCCGKVASLRCVSPDDRATELRERAACASDLQNGNASSACCTESRVGCMHEKYNCFGAADMALWGAEQKTYCCREHDVACPADCTAAACCEEKGVCAASWMKRQRTVDAGRAPVAAHVVKMRLSLAGDSDEVRRNPKALVSRMRRTLLKGSAALRRRPEMLVVTLVGVLMAGERVPEASRLAAWAVYVPFAWNTELAREEMGMTLPGAAPGRHAAALGASASSQDGIFVEYTVGGATEAAAADAAAQIGAAVRDGALATQDGTTEAVRPLGAASEVVTRTAAPKKSDDDSSEWGTVAAVVGAVLGVLCLGGLVAKMAITRRTKEKQYDALINGIGNLCELTASTSSDSGAQSPSDYKMSHL